MRYVVKVVMLRSFDGKEYNQVYLPALSLKDARELEHLINHGVNAIDRKRVATVCTRVRLHDRSIIIPIHQLKHLLTDLQLADAEYEKECTVSPPDYFEDDEFEPIEATPAGDGHDQQSEDEHSKTLGSRVGGSSPRGWAST